LASELTVRTGAEEEEVEATAIEDDEEATGDAGGVLM
jgi:hypothetical protein